MSKENNNDNEKTGLEKYGYRSLLRERERASNQESKGLRERRLERQKAKREKEFLKDVNLDTLTKRGGFKLKIYSPLLTQDFKKALKYKDYRTMRNLVKRYKEQSFPTNYVMRKVEPHVGVVIRIEYDPNITGVDVCGAFYYDGKPLSDREKQAIRQSRVDNELYEPREKDNIYLKKIAHIPEVKGVKYFDKYFPFDVRSNLDYIRHINKEKQYYGNYDFIGGYRYAEIGAIIGKEKGFGWGSLRTEGYIEFSSSGYAISTNVGLSTSIVKMYGYTLENVDSSIDTFEGWGSAIALDYGVGEAGLWISDDGGYTTPFNPTRPFVNKELWHGYFIGLTVGTDLLKKEDLKKNIKKQKSRIGAGWSRTETKVTFPKSSKEGKDYFFTMDWFGDPTQKRKR